VDLQGRALNGMAFSLYGGRATWDCAGKGGSITNPPPPAPAHTNAPTVPVTAFEKRPGLDNSATISASASDNFSAVGVQFPIDSTWGIHPINSRREIQMLARPLLKQTWDNPKENGVGGCVTGMQQQRKFANGSTEVYRNARDCLAATTFGDTLAEG
jgi:hypothetical protein